MRISIKMGFTRLFHVTSAMPAIVGWIGFLIVAPFPVAASPPEAAPVGQSSPGAVASFTAAQNDLLEEITAASFQYFWNEANKATGLIPDKKSMHDTCSVAAMGFGFAALPVGVERHYITREQGQARALLALHTLQNTKATKYGMFSHFLDGRTGGPATTGYETAASTVDSALCIAGALTAGQYFGGEVQAAAQQLYARMDWKAFIDPEKKNQVRMVWIPATPTDLTGPGKFGAPTWDWYTDEGLLITLLGIAAPDPAKRLDPVSMSNWNRPVGTYRNHTYVYSWPGTLFTYVFAHCYYDFSRTGPDRNGINWWTNTAEAAAANRDWCRDNATSVATYGMNRWGITASTTPGGYGVPGHQPRGDAGDKIEQGTIAPYGAAMALPWLSMDSMDALTEMRSLKIGGKPLWKSAETGGYGFWDAFSISEKWVSDDVLGIDQGPMLLCVENARTGLIWKLFMAQPAIQDGLLRAGFRVEVKSRSF